jgi:hypothetical protein
VSPDLDFASVVVSRLGLCVGRCLPTWTLRQSCLPTWTLRRSYPGLGLCVGLPCGLALLRVNPRSYPFVFVLPPLTQSPTLNTASDCYSASTSVFGFCIGLTPRLLSITQPCPIGLHHLQPPATRSSTPIPHSSPLLFTIHFRRLHHPNLIV